MTGTGMLMTILLVCGGGLVFAAVLTAVYFIMKDRDQA